ncbi:leucyl aminopeptidase family protein [Rheinheimera sp.]|uniref:M17 family metallopeptidase n=1 Tax=Rheinheimera sp. TaxID=1869214 RepID=UPI0027BA54A6|nr:leucyl aminopeptidase family protein [Rheinheimera sp.]
MALPIPYAVTDVAAALLDPQADAFILVAADPMSVPDAALAQFIRQAAGIDKRVGNETLLLHCALVPGQKLIIAPSGALHRDFDDVRCFADVAKQAVTLAKNAGARCPVVWVQAPAEHTYSRATEVVYLAMAQALWQPLEGREALGQDKVEPVAAIGVVGIDETEAHYLSAVEAGRRLARDLCGTEPERMAPRRFADYCVKAFDGSAVRVQVETDVDKLLAEYPLLMAVARSSLQVDRHKPAVIRLEYQGEGEITETLLFAGKGLVYDTGGADLKINGGMAGMSRDKGGAAAVAGFMQSIALLKPKGIRVIAEIGAVRNSIGSDAFVPDEIIKSHAGVRVRIGNTDAEGRLVLADLMSHLREDAAKAVNPTLFSVATLTGHAARAVGPYTALVENGAALRRHLSAKLAAVGDIWGDPSEVSRSRREDFSFIKARSCADDVLSCNNAPSSVTARGHQFPMAFLVVASGLDQASAQAATPLPYVHIDIAGSGVDGGDWQHGKPSASPVVALAAHYLL